MVVAVVGLVAFALVSRAAPAGHQTVTRHVSGIKTPLLNKRANMPYTVKNASSASALEKSLKGGFLKRTSSGLTSNPKSRTHAPKPNTAYPSFVASCHAITDGSDFNGFTAAVINPTATVTGVIDAANCNFGVYVGPGHTASISNAQIVSAGLTLSLSATSAEVMNNGGTVTVTNSTLSFGNDAGLFASDYANLSHIYPAKTTITGSTAEYNGDVLGGLGIDNESDFGNPATLTATNDKVDNNFTAQAVNLFSGASLTINGGSYEGGTFAMSGEVGIGIAFANALVNNATITQNADAGVYTLQNSGGPTTLNFDTVTDNDLDPANFPSASVFNDYLGALKVVGGTYGNDAIGTSVTSPDAIFNGGSSAEVDDAVLEGDYSGFENAGPLAELGNDTAKNNVGGVANHFGGTLYVNASSLIDNTFGAFNGDFFVPENDGSTLIMYSTQVTGNFYGVTSYASYWGNNVTIRNNAGWGLIDGDGVGIGDTATVQNSTITSNDATDTPHCDVLVALSGQPATFHESNVVIRAICYL